MTFFLANIQKRKTRLTQAIFLFLVIAFLAAPLYGQPFTKIVIDDATSSAGGVSWIDYDNDNDLDLYVTNFINADSNLTQDRLFRNDGNGVFVKMSGEVITDAKHHSRGVSWADYNNDGNIDVYITNRNSLLNIAQGSLLYKNEGNASFGLISGGDIGASNSISGLGAAWGDYNNDGFVDLFIATPAGLAYPNDTLRNALFDNNGDGAFTRNLNSLVVNGEVDGYTMASWSDYDQDGDLDLCISAGPIRTGMLQQDYFYRNLLMENGTATFERDLVSAYAVEPRDGQEIQWIDYDNDGDLDMYATNYGGTPGLASGMGNHLYRNDGNSFTKITTGSIVTDTDITLGQVWGDFDNDGDLDLYTSNQTSANNFSGGHRYYQNDGPPNYTFSKITGSDFVATNRIGWGAAAGDYDSDGDLDLYVTINTVINQPDFDALYRNDVNNGNNWVNFTLEGIKTDIASTGANRSAIGAFVSVKAAIFGNSYWQLREVATNHGFNGQNSLQVHFGLGDATIIDSLLIRWPGSMAYTYTNVAVNQFYRIIEGQGPDPVAISTQAQPGLVAQMNLHQNYPNPFNPSTNIEFQLANLGHVQLKIYDIDGRLVKTLLNETRTVGNYTLQWDGKNSQKQAVASGVYFYQIQFGAFVQTRKMLLLR